MEMINLLGQAALLGAAAAMLVQTWLTASVFEYARVVVEAWAAPTIPEGQEPSTYVPPWPIRFRAWAAKGLLCRYCLSHHVVFWTYVVWQGPRIIPGTPWYCWLPEAMIVVLAAIWFALMVPVPEESGGDG